MAEEEIIEIAEIVEDVKSSYKRAKKRLAEARHIEAKESFAEIADNIYPLLSSIAAKLQEQEDGLMELAEGGEFLAPESAGTVLAALELGEKVCVTFLASNLNDVDRKKAEEICKAFRAASGLAQKLVGDLIAEDAGDEEEQPEDNS